MSEPLAVVRLEEGWSINLTVLTIEGLINRLRPPETAPMKLVRLPGDGKHWKVILDEDWNP